MTEKTNFNFIPGLKIQENQPLDRYLPPIWKGVASTWLKDHIPQGSWLLDPFGASPQLAIEAASLGYNVIVTANNPVTRFILEMLCDPPLPSEFQAAIALLASSMVGNDRLEPHIKSLYETVCAECNRKIQVETFLWRRGDSVPYARIYQCPHCGDSGERPTVQFDIDKAEKFSKTGMHRARALERVAPLRDPDRYHVEEALEVYLPRAIYSLVTIINKLSSIPETDPSHRLLSALLLLTFDRANTLWLYPKERQRPRQLTVPSIFREHNIWNAIESAIKLWTSTESAVSFTTWPDPLPKGGGICLFEGRIRELAITLPKIDVSAILTVFPRPNQAFWTLSALWSGWLWGPEAVEHFKSVLRRRRYDWGWHTNALQTALHSLSTDISENTPYFGLINELEPGFLSAVLLGCQIAGLRLGGLALRIEDEMAQVTCKHSSNRQLKERVPKDHSHLALEETICQSTQEYLCNQRGEPSRYINLHAVGLATILNNKSRYDYQSPGDYLSQVQSTFHQALSYRKGFLRYGGSEKSLEVGKWWLQNPDVEILPLADRIEINIVNYLLKNPGSSLSEIDNFICRTFSGLLTPTSEMVQVCLASYAHQDQTKGNQWYVQLGDHPDRRRKEILEVRDILIKLGKVLGFDITKLESEHVVEWGSSKAHNHYKFFISASGVLGKYLLPPQSSPGSYFIVLPGSRSNLVAYKLKQNPYFKEIVDKGWRFIKYRHIRRLAESSTLNLENLNEQLSLDPLTYSKTQIRLL
jgi:hypothetical protein